MLWLPSQTAVPVLLVPLWGQEAHHHPEPQSCSPGSRDSLGEQLSLGSDGVGVGGAGCPERPDMPAPHPPLQSVFTLGAAAGGLSAMVLNDLLGRKLSIMFSAVPSAAGYALMAGAHGLWMLLLGRILTGFAGGLTAACIPVRPGLPRPVPPLPQYLH